MTMNGRLNPADRGTSAVKKHSWYALKTVSTSTGKLAYNDKLYEFNF